MTFLALLRRPQGMRDGLHNVVGRGRDDAIADGGEVAQPGGPRRGERLAQRAVLLGECGSSIDGLIPLRDLGGTEDCDFIGLPNRLLDGRRQGRVESRVCDENVDGCGVEPVAVWASSPRSAVMRTAVLSNESVVG
jgi:hypothetical protein